MRLLVLAGTSEARNLAQAIDALPNVEVIASLAGETRRPADLGVETRIGGFGGEVGFASYLTDTAITHVIDATHPFAANITRTAAAVCGARKLPFTILQRPAWEPNTDDKWHMIDQARDCADLIARGKTVFWRQGVKRCKNSIICRAESC